MKRPTQCARCGSRDVIEDAKVIDHTHHSSQTDLSLGTYRNPQALIFKGQVRTTVSAWVCASCGFIELYADNPGNLKIEPS